MSDFKLEKLSELVSRVKVGFVGSINEFYCEKENGIPLIRTTDITELGIDYSALKYVTKEFHIKNKKSHIKKGDLIIARHGENGKANVFDKDFDAQVLNAVIIEPDQNKMDSILLKYFFDSPFIKKQILGVVKGSVQGVINTAHIAEVLIPINDKINYKELAKILDNLDSKIELNNKINAELEAMAKTIYDYWFVQFDFPNGKGKPYKSSGGKMAWNEELKREIPKGWEVRNLGDYAAIKKGVLITEKTANTNGNVKVVSAGIDFSYYHSESNYPENTITISASGASAGYINFWREPIFACDCTTVRGKTTADTLQILGFLRMRQEFIYNQARGSAQPHVYPKDIEGLLFPTPPSDLVERFGNLVVAGNEKIAINIKENQQLASLRDWLLPMLMNGQVKVKDAEKMVKEKLGMAAEAKGTYKAN